MAAFEIVVASGKAYCRGGSPDCICDWKSAHRGKIPKGAKALVISISHAGGGGTAHYCYNCMVPVLERMREVLDKA